MVRRRWDVTQKKIKINVVQFSDGYAGYTGPSRSEDQEAKKNLKEQS